MVHPLLPIWFLLEQIFGVALVDISCLFPLSPLQSELHCISIIVLTAASLMVILVLFPWTSFHKVVLNVEQGCTHQLFKICFSWWAGWSCAKCKTPQWMLPKIQAYFYLAFSHNWILPAIVHLSTPPPLSPKVLQHKWTNSEWVSHSMLLIVVKLLLLLRIFTSVLPHFSWASASPSLCNIVIWEMTILMFLCV